MTIFITVSQYRFVRSRFASPYSTRASNAFSADLGVLYDAL
jgi:hypothetical protein